MRLVSPHIITGYPGALGRPPVVKLVNVSVETVREVRAAVGPDTLIVIRWTLGPSLPTETLPALQAAVQWVKGRGAEMLAMRAAAGPEIAFEGLNEVADNSALPYAYFERQRLKEMHALGLRAVAGNFSVGTPDFPVWKTYNLFLEEMDHDDFLGLHEYWADTNDLQSNRYHFGRWTLVKALAGVDLSKYQIVVTETGRDLVEGKGAPGWHKTCDAATFLKDIHAADAIAQQWPNVRGLCLFTVGDKRFGADGKSDWNAFECDSIWPRIVAEQEPWQKPAQPKPQEPPKPARTYPAKVAAPGVYYADDYCTQNHEDRQNTAVTHLVIHDTEGPVNSALAWFANPQSQVSAHDVITESGLVYRVVPYDRAAWHAGGPTSQLNPGANLKSIGIELVYPAAPASPEWPYLQLKTALLHCRELVKVFGIKRANVRRHADIDPTRKKDPRNFPWTWFLDQLYAKEMDMDGVVEAIRKAAWAQAGVAYNPAAAFPTYARAHNLGEPTGPESGTGTDIERDGHTYRWQRFTGAIVACEVGRWGECFTVEY